MAAEINNELNEPKEPELEIARLQSGRIRYADDVENHPRRGRDGQRRLSMDSMSIRSVSRRRQVEPNVALPVQYRTL